VPLLRAWGGHGRNRARPGIAHPVDVIGNVEPGHNSPSRTGGRRPDRQRETLFGIMQMASRHDGASGPQQGGRDKVIPCVQTA
jgi:hypothetical protein